MTLEVWAVGVSSGKASKYTGGSSQQRAFGLARSRQHFAKLLIGCGLEYGTPSAVSQRIKDRACPTGNAAELAIAKHEGQIWITNDSSRVNFIYVQWPHVMIDSGTTTNS